LNSILGFFFWLNLRPLGWAILCKDVPYHGTDST
jgi:hypothetical protein